jgi:hypothetical protein
LECSGPVQKRPKEKRQGDQEKQPKDIAGGISGKTDSEAVYNGVGNDHDGVE